MENNKHVGIESELWESLYGEMTPNRTERIKRAHALYHSFKAKMLARRTFMDIVADRISAAAGSINFVIVHAVWFAIWILINIGWLPIVPIFDPFPFGLMTMIVSLEAIFLSIFVLMSQNRGGSIADIREEIDFQITVQAEQEVTKLLQLVKEIHEHQGLSVKKDAELERMVQQINPEEIEEEIENELGGANIDTTVHKKKVQKRRSVRS